MQTQNMDLAQAKQVAKLVPYQEEEQVLFGRMRGSAVINEDIIAPIDVEWEEKHLSVLAI